METVGYQTLSERKRECPRLVADHLQSKEIARLLGISSCTVNEHCDNPRAKLKVATRFKAARLLSAHGGHPYPLTGEPIRVEARDVPFQTIGATTEPAAASGGAVGEARTIFVHEALLPDLLAQLPLASEGRPRNDLTTHERITAIGWITGRLVFYLALTVIAAEALSRLLYKLAH